MLKIILPNFWKTLKKKKDEQLDDEFDVECLQEDELQKIGGDNAKKGTMDAYLKGK